MVQLAKMKPCSHANDAWESR